ncbi:hypothetical protein [Burkholderia sp. BCC1998]|nr:hypothetical protein [Burkholderia sp. BCC1998]
MHSGVAQVNGPSPDARAGYPYYPRRRFVPPPPRACVDFIEAQAR